jgi:small nuclear ribonucleoprotein (snRNP)-like protein
LEIVVVVLVGLAALLATARLVLDWAYSWRTLIARRVVVNLKSGRGVDGLLVRKSGDLLFIREATALEPGATPQAIDGETVVQRGDIDFIQTLVRGGV